MTKLKRKKLKKNKEIESAAYPDEKNPFGTEENGLTKKHKSKKKKNKKSRKKLKTVEEKRERAISKAILDENQVTMSISKTNHVNDQPGNSHIKHYPAPSGVPMHMRYVNSNSVSKPSVNTDPKTRKKPSEGDIKSLHKNTRNQSYCTSNPFADDIAEEQQIQEEALAKNEAKPQADHHHASQTSSHAVKIHRGASILNSSRERSKKKRLRIIKGFKKKKKNKKKDIAEEEKDLAAMSPRNPKSTQLSQATVVQLRHQVNEVNEIVKNQVEQALEKRESNLSILNQSIEQLERSSQKFAEVSREVNVKMHAQSKCCGLFARNRCCRYLCTCNMPLCLRRKFNKKATKEKKQRKSRVHGELSDDDDAYERADTSLLNDDSRSEICKAPESYPSTGSLTNKKSGLLLKSEKTDSKHSLRAAVQNKRFLQSLDKTRLQRRKSGRTRATSSMGDLDDIIAETELRNVDKSVRRSIQENIMQYEDKETKRRAMELLLLDYT